MSITDENYIQQCLDLALKGIGHTAPNPMVGAIIVHNGEIIGQGFHEGFGKPHAEVNAINSVEKKSLLHDSTLYVNLEPCAHYGKTPPCADLIVVNKIQKVVIGSSDPFPKVAGKGIKILKNAGIDVITGVLENECIQLNKRFYTFYQKNRPYIILKWAQTNDGFIGTNNQSRGESLKITNQNTNHLVHQWRSEEQAILVGTGTILLDDPQLNVRHVEGRQPIPFVFGNGKNIPDDYKIHSFNPVFFHSIDQIITYCAEHKILSILVEGGPTLLNHFIKNNFWDEARIITNTKMNIRTGLKAPVISIHPKEVITIESDQIQTIYNSEIK